MPFSQLVDVKDAVLLSAIGQFDLVVHVADFPGDRIKAPPLFLELVVAGGKQNKHLVPWIELTLNGVAVVPLFLGFLGILRFS